MPEAVSNAVEGAGSLPGETSQTVPSFEFNKYFVHRLKNGQILLITNLGRFVSVSREELRAMQAGSIFPELFEKLEQAHIIVSEKNRPAVVSDYRVRYGHVGEGISLHIVNPTMKCNQACPYCYANSAPLSATAKDMDEETAKKVVDFIWQTPRKDIVIEFQGGEPLANFPIMEFIINYAKKKKGKNVHWRIVSNLTMMDEAIAKFLQKNMVFDLCTSLDGPKKVHDKNRPLAGASSYSKAVHWLNRLGSDYGFKHLAALCTVTRHSLPFAKEIVDTYLELGLPDITPVPLRRIGLAGKNWESLGYSPEEYTSFWKETVDYCIEMTRKGRPISEQFSVLMLSKINRVEPSHHTCFSKPCGAALMQASYQPNGGIFTCDEAKAEPIFRIGHVKQPYKQVFTSPEALNMVSLSSSLGLICNECEFTGFCSFCPVLAYSTQKNFIPKLALDESCRTKKAQFSFLLEKLFSKDKEILLKWVKANN